MNTREQAEQAYHRERPNSEEYESRIISMEQVDWKELEQPDDKNYRYWMVETVDWQEDAWHIGFDYRWKENDEWEQWHRGYCYVVEPKPGPYVVK